MRATSVTELEKKTSPYFLQSGPHRNMRPGESSSKKDMKSQSESSTAESKKKPEKFNILKDNEGRRKQHSRSFMARKNPVF
ncbi:hypothetical protein TNCV_4091591 [Trichonephila clavipes]|nr:hypothetical protein TNCV_4091591 [Trichonephila clavipes]